MSRIKGRGNAATELRLITIFREYKIAGWRRNSKLFGKPDFVFPALKIAVFVDGCFWHGCPLHGSIPETNKIFWENKLARNKRRDKLVRQVLRHRGWHVVRLWQHNLKKPAAVARRMRKLTMI